MKNNRLLGLVAIAVTVSMLGLSLLNLQAASMGWKTDNGKSYWYENEVKQGTYDDAKGVIGNGTVRGREIFDPVSDGWYWLDACYEGAKACDKEVWMPYVYQDEKKWTEANILEVSKLSKDMAQQVVDTITNGEGKWVRYDANGKMIKGWYTVDGDDALLYPKQVGNTYYYDHQTGLMAKGKVEIDGIKYEFDKKTGVLLHTYTRTVDRESTCEGTGEARYTCSCGDNYTEVISALGHAFGEYHYNNDATEEKDGTETATCSRCGKTDTRVKTGTKLEPTTEEPTEGLKSFYEDYPDIPSLPVYQYGTRGDGTKVTAEFVFIKGQSFPEMESFLANEFSTGKWAKVDEWFMGNYKEGAVYSIYYKKQE